MNTENKFFSSNHTSLLNTAWVAKNLTWVVIIVFTLSAGAQIIQFQNNSQFLSNFSGFIRENPWDVFRLGVDILSTLLKGAIYFLVLEGVSLGLNMIVETDINYREQKGGLHE